MSDRAVMLDVASSDVDGSEGDRAEVASGEVDRAVSDGAIMRTKTAVPQLPPGYVRRTRIDAQLELGRSHPVTLVSAGPGWGKTLAVAAWLDAARIGADPAAWLSLDPDDNAPGPFWTAVLSSLRAAGAIPADNPLGHLEHMTTASTTFLRRLRNGLAELPRPTSLVLDEMQLIDDPDVLHALTTLLRHRLPLRLVLVTRRDPVLPLHRLRVAGELVEVRQADLAFTKDEAGVLLRATGHPLPPDELAALVRRTEGWATGVRLAAMYLARSSAAGDTEPDAADFGREQRAVADYLLGEVLDRQPPATRAFLLRTSVVARVCAPLGAALGGRSDEGGAAEADLLLADLERSNTFVTALGADRVWYRYHPLLRDVLAHQFAHTDPGGFRAAHRAAAVWFAAAGEPIEAMRHAADAHDWDLIVELFVTSASQHVVSAQRHALDAALATIPYDELPPSVGLELCRASRLIYAERYQDLAAQVASATRLAHDHRAPADEPPALQVARQVVLALYQASAARIQGDLATVVATSTTAMELLAGPDAIFPSAGAYRAVVAHSRGTGLLWTGEIDLAHQDFDTGLRAAQQQRLELMQVNLQGHLALVHVIEGRLRQARDVATQALALSESRGWGSLRQNTVAGVALALVDLLQGRTEDAERALARIVADQEATIAVLVHVAQAFVAVDRRRHDAAGASIRRARAAGERWPLPTVMRGWLDAAEVDLALSTDDARRAVRVLGALPSGTSSGTSSAAVRLAQARLALGEVAAADSILTDLHRDPPHGVAAVEMWVLTAVLADRQRQDHRALDAVRRAVALAAPEDARRPFLSLGSPRLGLLLDREIAVSGASGFISEVRAQVAGPGARDEAEPEPLDENLTERELTVLQMLPSMMSNAEIADEIFVSVNTVKAHLKALYRKLDVDSRRDAVRRGRALGLL